MSAWQHPPPGGERFSSDLGLYYLRAWWYDADSGRFL
jgi:hypothetical protein